MNIRHQVPTHLEDLKNLCVKHFYKFEMDEKSFANIAFKLIKGDISVIEVADFIVTLKDRLETIINRYDDLRYKVNAVNEALADTSVRIPCGYTHEDRKRIKSLLDGLDVILDDSNVRVNGLDDIKTARNYIASQWESLKDIYETK